MRVLFVIAFVSLMNLCAAQDTLTYRGFLNNEERSTDVWVGYSLQGNWSDETGKTTLKYLEVGIGKGRYLHHHHGISGGGVYLSEEILLNGNKAIYGTKLGCFVHSLIGFGFSVIYYTDFERGNLKLRPEIGVGVGRAGILVGYNIPTVNNKAMPELQRQNAQVTFRAGFGMKKKRQNGDRNSIAFTRINRST